jgi:DNA repair protein RecN (Recombination protein N)
LLRRLRIENLVLIREAELDFAPGLNAVTGETGAGKTIFAQAIGLLLGTRGDATAVGPAGEEAYVEAEFDLPDEAFRDDELVPLAEVRPADEAGIVLARRIFPDGRTRAYAWGRAIAREDLAAAGERLLSMSGQFEQRRLARPAYQLETLDGFSGPDQLARRRDCRDAWRALGVARRRHDELERDAGAETARLEALRLLVEETEGLQPAEEDALRGERERLFHGTDLADALATAITAVAPEDGDGATSLAATAERALAPVERLAPELAHAAAELRDLALRLGEVGSDLHRSLASLESDPARLEEVESRLEGIADLRRRFRCETTAELLERRAAAAAELTVLDEGMDPLEAAARELAAAEARFGQLAGALHDARDAAVSGFAARVVEELHGLGLGDGEFRVELRAASAGPSGRDEASFLIRPNPGLPFGPVAETASGGELSRVALALAAVAGGETMVFDEIDAGIGGQTAHRVAETLQRLGTNAQVITITHLPQIASVAERQFRVEKVPGDPTHTRIELLDDAQRRDELERMLGGQEFLATVAGGAADPGSR